MPSHDDDSSVPVSTRVRQVLGIIRRMAREVGPEPGEITTDAENTTSQRVIEANVGRLLGEPHNR
jgi:predicted acetyltransferase